MVLSEQYKNIKPCEVCQLLGQTSRDPQELLLVTLSPNPEWKDYGEELPEIQLKMLEWVHKKAALQIRKDLQNMCRILSAHYEFNKTGNLHAHCLFETDYVFNTADMITLSKIYHRIIGRSYVRSSICCDVRRITDSGIYQYLNKENAYPPKHYKQNNILTYMPQEETGLALISDEDPE